MAGYGWSVAGLPCISLIPRTKYYDGYSAAADVNGPNPSFALDGIPLVESEEYAVGTTGYPFKTARGHVRVKRTIAGFEALYPDGSRAAFGIGEAGPNSSLQVSYPVTEMEDIYGRRMEISYLFDNGMFYPDTIRYDMSNVEPSRIIFSYDNRTDHVDMYYASSPVSMRKLLKSIKSEVDGEELRTYTLVHSDRDYVSALDSLKCTLGGENLSPLSFSYGVPGQNTNFTQGQTVQLPLAASESPYGKLFSRGKFLQDSYNDGVLITPWYENYGATFTSGDGEHSQCGSLYDAGVRVTLLPDLTQSAEMKSIAVGAGFQEIQALDIDCDGTDEIVKLNFISVVGDSTVLGVTTYKLNTILSELDSTFFTVKVLGRVNDAGFISPQRRFYRYGVFRQDGSCCLLTTGFAKDHTGAYQNGYSALVDLRAGVVLTEEELFEINPGEDFQLFVADLNGDGISEICHVDEDGMNVYRYDNGHIVLSAIYTDITSSDISDGYHLTDLNGDGLTDIVCMSKTADRWSSFVYTGSGFQKHVSTIAKVQDGTQVMFMDLDKDGLSDFIRIESDGLVECCLNDNGALVMASPASITVPANSRLLPSNVLSYNGASSIAVENGGMILPYSYGRNVLKKRTMTSILDSFRNKTTVCYSDLSDADGIYYSHRSHYATGKYTERLVPIAAVKEVSVESAGVLAERKRYRYGDIVLSTQGAGLVCFGRFDEKDIIQGASRRTINDPDVLGAGVEMYEYTGSEFNTLRGWGINTVNPVLNSHGNATDARVVSSSTYDSLSGIHSGQNYVYDTLGFPVGEVVRKWKDADTTTVKTETKAIAYSHSLSDSLYVLGAVTEEQAYKGVLASKTEYTLDSLKRPTRTKTYAGTLSGGNTAWNLTSDRIVAYDVHGNVTNDRTAAYGATTYNEITYTYDNAGRHLTASSDPLGRTTTYLNYNKYGNPTQIRDWLNRQTLSTYDTWGNLISKTDPDSTVTVQTKTWSTSGEPGLYCVSKTVTGQPDTKVWYDALGREVRSANKRFDGSWQYVTTEYNGRGRLSRTSLPYKNTATGPTLWNTYEYDSYNRPIRLSEASGKQTTWSYSGTSTTMVKDSLVTTSTTDAEGNVVRVVDTGGTIDYSLRDDGQPSAVILTYGTAPNQQTVTTTFQYDSYGRRTAIIDPSAGTRTDAYTDNADGSSSVAHTGPNGTVTTNYDRFGRVTSVTRPEFNTSYTYGTTLYDSSYGKLLSETSTNGTSKSFTYDGYGRPLTETEHADSTNWLRKTYTYGTGSNIASINYATQDGSITTETFSYANGHNTAISATGSGNATFNVFTLTGENALGQPTAATTGSAVRAYSYTSTGIPSGRQISDTESTTVQNFSYSYAPISGNMLSRADNVMGIQESFNYDAQNRLLGATESWEEWTPMEFVYENAATTFNSKGNITSRTYDGMLSLNITYGNSANPYEATSADSDDPMYSGYFYTMVGPSITTTSFDRPASVAMDPENPNLTYKYNASGEKAKMTMNDDGFGVHMNRYYLGGVYEKDENTGDSRSENAERLFLGGTAYDAPMVLVKTAGVNEGTWTPFNIGRDVQGSITEVLTADGEIVERFRYDPWGVQLCSFPIDTCAVMPADDSLAIGEGIAIVDTLAIPDPWQLAGLSVYVGSHGYTSHEHIYGLGIINCNARLYDPVLGRFLAPDPLIQDPASTQNFNRYSYCLNNPLKYTDPDGEIALSFILATIVVPALMHGMLNTIAHAYNNDDRYFRNFLQGFIVGAAIGLVTAGVGQLAEGAGFIAKVASLTKKTADTLYDVEQVCTLIGVAGGTMKGITTGDWDGLERTARIFLGRFYYDETQLGRGALKGISRHSWEFIQTSAGASFTQLKNAVDLVDRVDYYHGITYATNESSSEYEGVTLGNYINMDIGGSIVGDFGNYVEKSDQMFAHEYGHTIQGRMFGPLYSLLSVLSFGSAVFDYYLPINHSHNHFFTEVMANRFASKNFSNYLWPDVANKYPIAY